MGSVAGEKERKLGQGTEGFHGSESEKDEEPLEASAEERHDVTCLI